MFATTRRLFTFVAATALLLAVACGSGGDDENILAGQSGDSTPTATSSSQGSLQPTATRPAGTSSTPTTSATRTATTTPAATLTGDAGDVQKAMMNLATQKSFRAKLTADAGATGKFDVTIELSMPDKIHVSLANAPAPFSGLEAIVIGQDLYVKTAGKWAKQSTGDLGLGTLNPADLTDLTSDFSDLGATTTVAKGSTETVNGKRCQVYTIKDSADPTTTGDICIADNLPQKLTIKLPEGTATVTFSDFNANINIQKPI